MPTAEAHYVRIYQALGIFPNGRLDVTLEIPLRPNIRITIGPEPTQQYYAVRYLAPKYMIPEAADKFDEWPPLPYERFRTPGTPLPTPLPLYTEVHCWIRFPISTSLDRRLRADLQDARNELSDIASDYQADLEAAADLGAGLVALRLHRQYVARMVTDMFYANAQGKSQGTHSRRAEPLDPVVPSRGSFEKVMLDFKKGIFTRSGDWRHSASILRWLLRACDESDEINRFIALFLPLELLVAGESPDGPSTSGSHNPKQLRGKLKQLIRRCGGADEKELRAFLDTLEPKRPALLNRFASYATRIGLPTAAANIAAFQRYNNMRNDLFHGRGLRALDSEPLPSYVNERTMRPTKLAQVRLAKALRGLTDLTERYICHAVFGDTDVYQSYDRRKGLG